MGANWKETLAFLRVYSRFILRNVCEITPSDQTRGTEWEFRVIAVSKVGEGVPSNTVMVVL